MLKAQISELSGEKINSTDENSSENLTEEIKEFNVDYVPSSLEIERYSIQDNKEKLSKSFYFLLKRLF